MHGESSESAPSRPASRRGQIGGSIGSRRQRAGGAEVDPGERAGSPGHERRLSMPGVSLDFSRATRSCPCPTGSGRASASAGLSIRGRGRTPCTSQGVDLRRSVPGYFYGGGPKSERTAEMLALDSGSSGARGQRSRARLAEARGRRRGRVTTGAPKRARGWYWRSTGGVVHNRGSCVRDAEVTGSSAPIAGARLRTRSRGSSAHRSGAAPGRVTPIRRSPCPPTDRFCDRSPT